MDKHELHARRMPADRMQGDAWRQLRGAVVEFDALRKIEPHDPDHVLDLERAGEERMAHVASGRVVQFDLLQVELRARKPVKIADMVVVHVRQHDVLDGTAVDADQRQRLDRAPQKPPLARRSDLGGKAGVDDDSMMRRDPDPYEIVHRHRAVMRIAADKMIGTQGVALGVTDRGELVFREMGVHERPRGPTLGSDLGIAKAPRRCEPAIGYSRREESEP